MINEQIITGLASIDRPWMKQYQVQEEKVFSRFQGKTVWEVAEEYLEQYSDVPLIEYFGNVISRMQFHEYVIRWANTLKALGVKAGEVIPVYIPAIPEAFALFFAANAIGAIPYYLKIDISREALEVETKESKIAVVFDQLWSRVKDVFQTDRFEYILVTTASDSMKFPMKQIAKMRSRLENRSHAVPRGRKYIRVADFPKTLKGCSGGGQDRGYKVPFQPDRIAVITSSSGTTSHNVKGIMDTNEGILNAMACSLASEPGLKKGSRMFTCFPLLASTSLNCEHLLPLFTGGTIVMDPRADMSMWYHHMMKYKPDAAVSTGSVWEAFVRDILEKEKKGKKHDLSWVDYYIVGGSGTTPENLAWMNKVLLERGAKRELTIGYGMSEGFGVLAVDKYKKPIGKAHTDKPMDVIGVGTPLYNYTIAIFNEKSEELPYGRGLRGEIWIKTPANMHGYYGKPALTSETIVDGWIHSGDYGEMDANGNLYCYGRIQNAITISGERTYLFDIAIDLRKRFDLRDILVEKKMLKTKEEVLNVYFVQKENKHCDSHKLIREMDSYLQNHQITISGYKEHEGMIQIDPTTLKPRTKDTDGFTRYIHEEKYRVSYREVETDIYEEVLEKDDQ